MNNYKLIIQYDGRRYKGWQRLGNTENTIQGKIENVLSEMLGEKIEIIGSSRTDAGVHAFNQIANFKTTESLNELETRKYLNRYLPQDISIKEVMLVAENFHSRYNAKSKTYLYKIWNEEYTNPFIGKYSMHIDKKLNIKEMKKACQYFIGSHDFTTFSNAKSKKKSMVREIYSLDIEVKDGLIEVRVKGNGFLYNMVRKIVGTLIEVGLHRINAESIPEMINSKKRNQVSYLADSGGLYLEEIEF